MSLRKKIQTQINKRPVYQIADEYTQNVDLARSAAFGRDRAIQAQESNIEQQAADDIGVAQDYSNSASSILATLASISGSKNTALRNLAVDESTINRAKMNDLYGANVNMAEEKDKAFEYNVNTPYQKALERIQERKRRRQLQTDALTGAAIAVGGSAATEGTTQYGGSGNGESNGQGGLMGMLGSIFSDEQLKENIIDTTYGLNEVMRVHVKRFLYKDDSMRKSHIGFIAQELFAIIPEAIDHEGEFLKVNNNELVAVLFKAIQEQQQQINALKKEISHSKQIV